MPPGLSIDADLLAAIPGPAALVVDGRVRACNHAWSRLLPQDLRMAVEAEDHGPLRAALRSPGAGLVRLATRLDAGALRCVWRLTAADAGSPRLVTVSVDEPPRADSPEEWSVRELFQDADVAIRVTDREGRAVWMNDAASHVAGRSPQPRDQPVAPEGPPASLPAEQAQRAERVLRRGERVGFAENHVLPNGLRTFWTTQAPLRGSHGEIIGLVEVSNDVTPLHAQQREAAGLDQHRAAVRLAGDLAQQVQNPLLVVVESLIRAQASVAPTSPVGASLSQAMRAAEEIGRVVALAPTPGAPSPTFATTAAAVVGAALDRLSTDAAARVRVEGGPSQDLQVANGPMGEVVAALLQFAIDRSTDARTDPSAAMVVVRWHHAGGMLALDVLDQGAPLDGRALQALSDPYPAAPTEEKAWRLWMAWRTAQALGARLRTVASPDFRCALRLELPLVVEAEPVASSPQAEATAQPDRTRVLVVDDEADLVSLLVDAIAPMAEVRSCENGQVALQLIDREGFSPDLILCDLVMPEMGGMELFEELKTRSDRLHERLLFMTGGALSPQARTFMERHQSRVLSKPFRLSALRAAVLAARAS